MMWLSRKARSMATKEPSPQVQHRHTNISDGDMSAFLQRTMQSHLSKIQDKLLCPMCMVQCSQHIKRLATA